MERVDLALMLQSRTRPSFIIIYRWLACITLVVWLLSAFLVAKVIDKRPFVRVLSVRFNGYVNFRESECINPLVFASP